MRGDILFWPASNTLSDRIIVAFTDGPFVHCAVDMGDGTEISARSEDGVNRRPLTASGLTIYRPTYYVNYPPSLAEKWLEQQVGLKYSRSMVINSGLKKLDIPWRIYRVNSYDCSVLVAHYLEHLGFDLSDDDEALSPNDLARAVGVLKK